MSAAVLLQKELKELSKTPTYHITLDNDNIFTWSLGLYIMNPDSPWNHAYLRAQMRFPVNYPFSPPSFKFTPSIYHPNVYPDGRVCISILHEAGNVYSDEPSNENWSPAQCVESVLVSIISILDDPNISSPANVDASKLWRDHRDKYDIKVKEFAKLTQDDIPSEFIVPLDKSAGEAIEDEEAEDEDEWYFDDESEMEDDQSFYDDEEAEMSEDYEEEEEK